MWCWPWTCLNVLNYLFKFTVTGLKYCSAVRLRCYERNRDSSRNQIKHKWLVNVWHESDLPDGTLIRPLLGCFDTGLWSIELVFCGGTDTRLRHRLRGQEKTLNESSARPLPSSWRLTHVGQHWPQQWLCLWWAARSAGCVYMWLSVSADDITASE